MSATSPATRSPRRPRCSRARPRPSTARAAAAGPCARPRTGSAASPGRRPGYSCDSQPSVLVASMIGALGPGADHRVLGRHFDLAAAERGLRRGDEPYLAVASDHARGRLRVPARWCPRSSLGLRPEPGTDFRVDHESVQPVSNHCTVAVHISPAGRRRPRASSRPRAASARSTGTSAADCRPAAARSRRRPAAPATTPDSTAPTRAAWSTTRPRLVFTSSIPGLAPASRSGVHQVVAGLVQDGVQRDEVRLGQQLGEAGHRTPSGATRSVRTSCAITRQPKAPPSSATLRPIRPRPTIPSVRPAHPHGAIAELRQPPPRMAASPAVTPLVRASSRASACSATFSVQ